MIYKVTAVNGQREWDSKFGPMISYKLTVDADGESLPVELNQKRDSPPPTVGQEIDGTLEPGKEKEDGTRWPSKLKRTPPAGGKGGGMTPEREKAIVRQHSQHMALLYAQIRATQGKLPDDFSLDDLFTIAAAFDADVRSVV